MEIVKVLLAISLFQTITVIEGWLNYYDGSLNFECQRTYQSISQVSSVHNNHREDRLFDMSCSRVAVGVASCHWTGYVNDFDGHLAYACPNNGYISGMASYHNNRKEDRRWKIKCCEMQGIQLAGCRYTRWTNSWDGLQNFFTNDVMKGVISIHNNRKEDRLYKYEVCKVFRNVGVSGRRRVKKAVGES